MRSLVGAMLAATLGLVACDDGAATTEYDDLSEIVGTSIVTEDRGGALGALADSITISRGELPDGFRRLATGLVSGEHLGVAYRYFVLCMDAHGAAQRCDGTADNALVLAAWRGTLSERDFAGPMRRQAVWRLHGLTTPVVEASGDDWVMDQEARFTTAPQAHYQLTDHTDLLMFFDAAGPRLIGGSMHSLLAITELGADRRFDVRADVTLDSRTATVTLDDAYEYVIELAPETFDAR